MKTSEGNKNNSKCPKCNDKLARDLADRGFRRHMKNSKCKHGCGEKD